MDRRDDGDVEESAKQGPIRVGCELMRMDRGDAFSLHNIGYGFEPPDITSSVHSHDIGWEVCLLTNIAQPSRPEQTHDRTILCLVQGRCQATDNHLLSSRS